MLVVDRIYNLSVLGIAATAICWIVTSVNMRLSFWLKTLIHVKCVKLIKEQVLLLIITTTWRCVWYHTLIQFACRNFFGWWTACRNFSLQEFSFAGMFFFSGGGRGNCHPAPPLPSPVISNGPPLKAETVQVKRLWLFLSNKKKMVILASNQNIFIENSS